MSILNRFPISFRPYVSSAIAPPNRLALTHRGPRIHSTLSLSTSLSTNLAGFTNAHPHCNYSSRPTTVLSSAQTEQSFHPTSSTPSVLQGKTSSSRIPVQNTPFSFTGHSDHLRVKFGDGQISNLLVQYSSPVYYVRQIDLRALIFNSHYIWLRDNCRCSECFHPYTKQRLLDTFQVSYRLPTSVYSPWLTNDDITHQIPLDLSPKNVEALKKEKLKIECK